MFYSILTNKKRKKKIISSFFQYNRSFLCLIHSFSKTNFQSWVIFFNHPVRHARIIDLMFSWTHCFYSVFTHCFFTTDINECVVRPNACLNGVCINVEGSYQCDCGPGYRYNTNTKICSGKYVKYGLKKWPLSQYFCTQPLVFTIQNWFVSQILNILQISKPITGMFVLIWIDFSWWFRI